MFHIKENPAQKYFNESYIYQANKDIPLIHMNMIYAKEIYSEIPNGRVLTEEFYTPGIQKFVVLHFLFLIMAYTCYHHN